MKNDQVKIIPPTQEDFEKIIKLIIEDGYAHQIDSFNHIILYIAPRYKQSLLDWLTRKFKELGIISNMS